MRRNKPDVWEVCSKVTKTVMMPKRDENKQVIRDEAGQPVMEEVKIGKGQCSNCKELFCRNAFTLGPHYNKCIGKEIFDNKGYYIRSKSSNTNIKKRNFSNLSPNDSSTTLNLNPPKRQRTNSQNHEDTNNEINNEIDGLIKSVRNQTLQTPTKYKQYRQLLIEESCVLRKWGNAKQKLMDKILGLWIIDSNINYNAFQSVYCKILFRYNNPQCSVPGPQLIKRILLGIKKDIQSIVDGDMRRAGSCQIAMDGSSDKQEPLVHILALLPEPRLIIQKRHKWNKENAPQLFSDFQEASKYGERLGCKTTSGIGDNCNTNRSLNKEIKKHKPGCGCPGCSSHGWHLVNGDIFKKIPKNKNRLKKAKSVQRRLISSKLGQFIKQYIVRDIICDKIEKNHGITDQDDPEFGPLYANYRKNYNKRHGFLKTPATREWGSAYRLFENQLKMQKYIERVLDSDQIGKTKQYLKPTKKNKVNIKSIIQDEAHWSEMKLILKQYKPIGLRTKLSQGDINVSDVEYHWNKNANKYEDEDFKHNDKFVSESIRKRWALIEDDLHHAGKHSDPRRVGEPTTEESYKKAVRFYVANLGEEQWENTWVHVYNLFHDHSGVFEMRPLLNMKEHNMFDCIRWWKFFSRFSIKLHGKTIELKPFTDVMIPIQKARGTNAKIESTFNYVTMRQGNGRSSVGPQSLDVEVYCAVNMSFIGSERIFDFYGLSKDVLQKRKYIKKVKEEEEKKEADSDGNYSEDYASSYNSSDDSDSYGSDYSSSSSEYSSGYSSSGSDYSSSNANNNSNNNANNNANNIDEPNQPIDPNNNNNNDANNKSDDSSSSSDDGIPNPKRKKKNNRIIEDDDSSSD